MKNPHVDYNVLAADVRDIQTKQGVKMSEETKKPEWSGVSTDLSSFNAFGVVTLSDGQQVNVQMTNRHGLTVEHMYEDFKKFVAFLDKCSTDSAVKFWDGKKSGASSTQESQPGEKPKKSASGEYGLVEPENLPIELAELTIEVFKQDFDYFVVEPKPDEKASVKFYKDNLEWPVGAQINGWKHENVKKSLASVEEFIDPSKAEKYRVAGVQFWKKGGEYTISKGEKKGQVGNYKDLLLVQAVF